ncbi:ParB/RepB/Spo0J family partition protein [Mycobacteroides abscessus]|uniref:ParB/RepB/Spo0J family partition protein n=1 Tax=Mycobacteroides abscessus TaxID=36809 RepID=UPI0009A90930|nr:ParB/RepB/Spo0J family partition protein [Mycobacteroides abscessus]MBN7458303.1 ParB/RepB/Spo0J family partition protein [Mycobacteroides abscessus subsp. abscessus]SKU95212.1 ParB-like partition protein [Mycobacteroides abscessus subsp. bolletii]SLC73018.1 ParB-like partition protein [Mycobacteroides abscessus subsp. massiliense]SLJ51007.1 ParB-like partition protein [Mycobacteroides abscessus subsp. abscessus]
MTSNGSATAVKGAAGKAPVRKTRSRLERYRGGEDSAAYVEQARETSPEGITAGLASIAAADGQQVIQAPTSAVVPHPFNPPARSEPQPDDSEWIELVNSVRAKGVQVPVLLVTRGAFLQARPALADSIPKDAQYVIIYGHRRRAAAVAAGRETIPAVVDDEALIDEGDLDAMTIENLHRKGLTDLEQAEIFARYSEMGLSQRAIADRLGVNQSTVSRRLSLLLMAPEVLDGVRNGELGISEAAALVGKLPYGPPRGWQGEPGSDQTPGAVDQGQNTEERRSDQIAAYRLVVNGMTPKLAAGRVLAERRARARADKEGVEIVDAAKIFGPDHRRHAANSPTDIEGDVVAAIDELQGGLVYYPAEAPEKPTEADSEAAPTRAPAVQPPVKTDSKFRSAAMKARRGACPRLVASPPAREKMLPLLAAQYSSGMAALASSSAGWSLAFEFSRAANLASSEHPDVDAFRVAAAEESDLKRQLEVAWACAVAGFELHASDKARSAWRDIDRVYLQLLQDRANYVPTTWEYERLADNSHSDSGA